MPKRRQAAQELSMQRRSALNVRLFLRDFCSEFLENCYNRLMGAVKVRTWEDTEVVGIVWRGDQRSDRPVMGKKCNLELGVWARKQIGHRRDGEDGRRRWVIGMRKKGSRGREGQCGET